eukprot:5684437-Amphidinium_carterae.3
MPGQPSNGSVPSTGEVKEQVQQVAGGETAVVTPPCEHEAFAWKDMDAKEGHVKDAREHARAGAARLSAQQLGGLKQIPLNHAQLKHWHWQLCLTQRSHYDSDHSQVTNLSESPWCGVQAAVHARSARTTCKARRKRLARRPDVYRRSTNGR